MSTRNPYLERFGGESSVDFCEANFTVHSHVAEPYNTVSAIFLIGLGILGCIHCAGKANAYVALFILLIFVGFGTIALHATLSAHGQAADEVPMLLLTVGMVACLAEARGLIRNKIVLGLFTLLASIAVVLWYFYFQHNYIIFILSYSIMVAFIVFYLGYLSFYPRTSPELDRARKNLIQPLFLYGIASYLGFGFFAWITDMLLCDTVSQFFFGGLFLHSLWHLGAAIGSWCGIFAILAVREEFHGQPPPQLTWLCAGLLPCISISAS
mmetsp:Transcript_19251/g.24991  ORF Transcript_19251/g.24991 Transcript_19251/m.24991 type:complete len:268 (+) Transcript_19251:122-925(+)